MVGLILGSIVLIPGAEKPFPEDWPFCSPRWLAGILPTSTSRARIWAFNYEFPLGVSFSLQHIWFEGEQLLKLLSETCKAESSDEVKILPQVACSSTDAFILC